MIFLFYRMATHPRYGKSLVQDSRAPHIVRALQRHHRDLRLQAFPDRIFEYWVLISGRTRSFSTSSLEKRHQESSMLRAIRSLILFFLSIAALIGIKALDLHVLLTILFVIPAALVALISMLSFLTGKAPETTEPKNRERG
jgi:hypothetical protein